MTPTLYNEKYGQLVALVETRLHELCDVYLPEAANISKAARYSLLSGGKRIRAVLALAACELAGQESEKAVDYACALEMLHCYSLIHDDLPCMDNDDFRRGQPSCHIKFDEATALLAADALVTAAFEVVAGSALPPQCSVAAVADLAKAGGARGMLYGQELDKLYEKVRATETQLFELHRNKTGALIIAAVQLGCDAADARAIREPLQRYAAEIGLVFQIVDDILDVTSTTELLGKPVGSDESNDKTTFVSLYGLDGARALAKQHTDEALNELSAFGDEAAFLRQFACTLQNRNK